MARTGRRSAATALPGMPAWLAGLVGLVGGLLLFETLGHLGLARGPVWVPVLGCVLALALAQEGPQRRLGNGSLENRPALRILVGLLCFVLVLGCGGMSHLFPPAAVLVAVVHIDRSGSSAWRPAAVLAVLGTGALQGLVACGVLPTVVSRPVSHSTAAWSLLVALLVIASAGGSARQRERSARAVTRAEARSRALVHGSSDLIVVTDASGTVQAAYGAARALLGRDPDELLGRSHQALLHPGDLPTARRLLARVQREPGSLQRREVRVRHRDGGYRWHELSVQDLLSDPAVAGLLVHQRDVIERRARLDELARAADHDPLTGLLNRAGLDKALEAALHGRAAGDRLGVMFCDLDRFKDVNDAYGHAVGDETLVRAAARLRACLRPGDLLARLGGDEFVALLPELADDADADSLAARVRLRGSEPLQVGDRLLDVGVSVGIVLSAVPEHGPVPGADVAAGLLAEADLRMYDDKRRLRCSRT